MQNLDQNEYYSQLPTPDEPAAPVVEPTPNDPPWNSLTAVAVWILSVLLILVLPSLFLIAYLGIKGIPIAGNTGLREFALSDPTAVLLQLGSIVPAHLITLAICWLVVTRVGKHKFFQTLGTSLGGFRWWHFASILLAIYGCIIIVALIFPEQDNDMIRMLRSSRAAVVMVTILATFAAPIVEEIVYRGILYSAFQRSIGTFAAVAAVTLLFAGVHYAQYWGSPGTIIMITILSLSLTLVRASSKNLLPCIILHFLFNGLQSVVMLQQSLGPTDPVEGTAALIRLIN